MAVETTNPATAAEPQATVFTMTEAPLLSVGRFDRVIAESNGLTARVKVYAEGGENVQHMHANEDHLFLVLQGEATFHLGRDGAPAVVKPFHGVLLPAGAYYWFQSSGAENLVMFRVGTTRREDERRGPDGKPLPGGSKENKHVDGVPIPGKFFGR